MLLSIITVAFRNLEGIVKTHASLAHLAQADDISFEWIVVDGGSNDGTREYLENLNGIYNLRFVSEPDNGIYDAMNKGIAMAQGKFALFLNSGDIFHQDAANFVRKLKMQKDNVMITGDALLDFGDGHKIKRSAKPGWYIYHSLPASHQAIFFPVSGLKKWRYDLEYKVSSDNAWVQQTRRSTGDVKQSNLIRQPDGTIAFVVDFTGAEMKKLPEDTPVTAQTSIGDNGEIVESTVRYNPVTKGWRLVMRVKVKDAKKTTEMRAALVNADQTLSETWSYQLPANE